MVMHFIPVEQHASFSVAAAQARSRALKTRVLHAVSRASDGTFQVGRSAKERLGEFQALAGECGISVAGHDPEALRGLCMDEGLSPAGWRFIHRHGTSAYEAVLPFYAPGDKLLRAALAYAEWQARARLKTPFPFPLGFETANVFELWQGRLSVCNPKLAIAATRHWETLEVESARLEFIENQWRDVLEWMRDDQPKLDANQWRSGWVAIWRAFGKARPARGVEGDWSSSLDRCRIGEYEVTPLVSAEQLEAEGEAMHHCVAEYTEVCLEGVYRLFSIRKAGCWQRVATVGLKLNGGRWTLDQAKGESNETPCREVVEVAIEITDRYQLAG